MKQYQDILRQIINNGVEKFPTRIVNGKTEPVDGGVKTLCCPNVIFSHEMSDGFPLLTTKKMAWKTICIELEGFLNGIVSKQWYKNRGCNIWNEWCNPLKLNEKIIQAEKSLERKLTRDEIKNIQLLEDDLGPIYPWQLRKFNQCYDENDCGWIPLLNGEMINKADQLKRVVDTLHSNPYDRRMTVVYFNPLQMDRQSLPACHDTWNITAIGNKLHMFFKMRSVDVGLGLPFNIAHYALLLLLLCKESGLNPGNLTAALVDCHIYENQIQQLKLQLDRKPFLLPTVNIIHKKWDGIYKWTHEDVELLNYKYHPKIKMDVVI